MEEKVEEVMKLIDDLGADVSQVEWQEFLELIRDDLMSRLEAVREELRDPA